MGGNYEKGMYNQLMEVMVRLDAMESSPRIEKKEHKEDVVRLNKKIDSLTEENRLLKDDNARLRNIINYDSSNISLEELEPLKYICSVAMGNRRFESALTDAQKELFKPFQGNSVILLWQRCPKAAK